MVVCLHHLTFIQRQIHFLALLPTVALDGIETFRFKLRGGAKEVGIGCHVKQALYGPHWPRLAFPSS